MNNQRNNQVNNQRNNQVNNQRNNQRNNIDQVFLNIYNGCYIREDIKQNERNNKLLNRNLLNLNIHPNKNNMTDIENNILGIDKKYNKFRN
tara:strand:- start:1659 stop:1931 length:273 start_codon:yes stop_codon:yes gene_type:complete